MLLQSGRAFEFKHAVVIGAEVRRHRVVADQQISLAVTFPFQVPKLRLVNRRRAVEDGAQSVLERVKAEARLDLRTQFGFKLAKGDKLPVYYDAAYFSAAKGR